MAQRTVLGQSRRLMRRAVGAIEIVQMTIDTCPARKTVIAIDVALCALQAGMCAGERESGRSVIELRAQPLHRVVTTGAILREIGRFMVGIVGRIVVVQMARDAGGT